MLAPAASKVLLSTALVGATGIVAQVVVTRELLTNYQGNELTVGIVLAVWLLLEASGAMLARRVVRSGRAVSWYLCTLTLSFPLLFCSLWMSRTVRTLLSIPVGHAMNLSQMVLGCAIVSIPVGVLHGALFTLACQTYSEFSGNPTAAPGRVYVYETLGTLVGAAAFTFVLVANLSAFEIIGLLVVLGLCCVSWLALGTGRQQRRVAFIAAPLAVAFLWIAAGPYLQMADAKSISLKWPGSEVLSYADSAYGNLVAVRKSEQVTMHYDGSLVFTVPVPDIETCEQLAHLPLLFHPAPSRVLVVAGGLGGVLNEIQKHDISRLDYVEIDPLFVSNARALDQDLITRELSDPRLRVSHLDGRIHVNRSHAQYDVILVGIMEPSTLQVNRLFTRQFFASAKLALDEGGILAMALPGREAYLPPELLNLNASLYQTLNSVFEYVRVLPGGTNLMLASPSPQVMHLGAAHVAERLEGRHLPTTLISRPYLLHRMSEARLGPLVSSITGHDTIRHNTDLNPAMLFYTLSYWGAMYTPGVERFLDWVSGLNMGVIVLLSVLAPVLGLAVLKKDTRTTGLPVAYCVLTTGMAGMALDLILILCFQCFHGYVYHMLGMLVAFFMAGAVFGGAMAGRCAAPSQSYRVLVWLEAGIILLSALLVFSLRTVLSNTASVPLFLLGSALSGALVGATFPTASAALPPSNTAGGNAGLLYSLDLAGGFVAGLLCSIVLVPVFGVESSLWLIAGLKLGSLVALVTAGRLSPGFKGGRPVWQSKG